MQQYLDLLSRILREGKWKNNRTGIKTISISGHMFEHDMSLGFPLLTTKKMAFKSVAVELEGFIKGITSKKWYQDRGCHIWDEWCNPMKVPYGTDDETKRKMKEEDDLGHIYGYQWRNWMYRDFYGDQFKIDQFKNMIDKLKSDYTNRRIIVNSWNPSELGEMALPPCHYSYQLLSDGQNLDLLWNQRSCDVPLGVPFNVASYALLLTLISKEVNMVPRKLIGFLADTHIYENQLKGVEEQLSRQPMSLPTLEVPEFTNIYDWEHSQRKLINYSSYEKIDFPIAV